MKQFKSLVALVLVAVMSLALCGTAFADEPAYQHPVTVTGLDDGDVATFYHIVEWVGETADGSDVSGWKAISPYNASGLLDKAGLTTVLLGTLNQTSGKYENPTGITPALAGALAKVAANGTAVTAASNKASLTTNDAGIYMVLVTPTDANTLYNPIFVSADYTATTEKEQAASNYGTDSTAKKSTITLTKEANNASDYTPDTTARTTAVGDKITFTVTTTIPAYADVYTNPHFVVKDTLTDLELDTSSIKVDGNSSSANWEVSSSTSGYTITFKADYLKTVKSATSVTITYDATVTSSALKAINEETNDVSIEYSHNPGAEDDYDVKKDTTQHYTFSLDAAGLGNYSSVEGLKTSELVKIGVDAAGNPITQTTVTSDITSTESWTGPLAGAVFELYKTSDVTGTGTANDPYVVNANASYYKTATTGDDGRMNFAGLDAGTYYIKEKSAPAGYVTDSTVHKIELIAETDTVTVTEWWNGSAWVSTKPTSGTAKEVSYETEILKSYTVKIDGITKDTYTFTNGSTANDNEIKWTTIDKGEQPHAFTNTKGVELPSTGGIGTTIFYVAGIVLVLGAAAIIIARRKAEQN